MDPTVETVTIISKQEWNGEDAFIIKPYEDMIDTVRFTDTGTPLCKTKEECIPVMQQLQNKDLENEGWDIKYNFYIGGDGSVFEGRGWNVESWKPEELKDLKESCLDIAYLIDLKESKITPEMEEAGKKMLKYGEELGYLVEYSVIELPNKDASENVNSSST